MHSYNMAKSVDGSKKYKYIYDASEVYSLSISLIVSAIRGFMANKITTLIMKIYLKMVWNTSNEWILSM